MEYVFIFLVGLAGPYFVIELFGSVCFTPARPDELKSDIEVRIIHN